MNDAGGAFNYDERKAPIQERYMKDFHQAYARLQAAAKGLRDIYNYTDPLPDIQAPLAPGVSFFDQCLLWTREAIHFLVRFAQLDQNYVLPISVRNLITATQWEAAIEQAQLSADAPITWKFQIPDILLPNQRYIRLRGVSAIVVQDDDKNVWQVTIRPPKSGICRFLDDPTSAHGNKLNQGDVPPCRLGRVRSRDVIRDPDVVGVTALHNISPLGDPKSPAAERQWSVRVDRFSLGLDGSDATRDIKDVQIDLHIAMRSLT